LGKTCILPLFLFCLYSDTDIDNGYYVSISHLPQVLIPKINKYCINRSLVYDSGELNLDNQRIISSLVNSRHTFEVMHGFVNSLRSEILGLVSISAFVTCSTRLQFEYLEKLKSNTGDGFALGSAYKGEENDSIQEIKKELIKPIESMESKPEVKDRLTGALSNVLVHVR
jgi:hypothetical protein